MAFLLETHFHTAESSPCATDFAKDGVTAYINRGYNGIIVTDHISKCVCGTSNKRDWSDVVSDFLKGYKKAILSNTNNQISIFLGMELRFIENENDFLVYGFDEDFLYNNPWICEMTLEEFRVLANKNNLIIIQAHPFRDVCSLGNINCLDGIETYNGNPRHNSNNHIASNACKEHKLIATAGSDYHEAGDVGQMCVNLFRKPNNIYDIVNSLKNNEYKLIYMD